MLKKIFSLAFALILCVSLAACDLAENILYELLGSKNPSLSQNQTSSDYLPPPQSKPEFSLPVISSEPEPILPSITLMPDALALLGGKNKDLKQINGEKCETYIMYGGTPVADYIDENVPLPFSFWTEGDFENALEQHFDDGGHSPDFNFWPDDLKIVAISVWGDSIQTLFQTDTPVTYGDLENTYGQRPELIFTEAYGSEGEGYPYDTWEAKYPLDGYTLEAKFVQGTDDYEMFVLLIAIDGF